MVTVEDLYKHFGVLADAKDQASKHEDEYKAILAGVKGGVSEKRLASQFIIRFFKHFPHLAVDSINAMFDLCEDADIMIRKQAIKDLPQLCKATPDQVCKITEALTMLLACDDNTERSLVYSSISAIFKVNPKEALAGLFSPLIGEEDSDSEVTEATLKFFTLKLKGFQDDWLDAACEETVVENFKKMLSDVNKAEFILIMNVMKQLKIMSTVQGRQQLVDIIATQADLGQPFNAAESEDVDRLVQCVRQASHLFSKNVHSKPFVTYMCDKVLPNLKDLATSEDNREIEILRLFADITEHSGDLDDHDSKLQLVYDKLITYMPEPPAEAPTPETSPPDPDLQFSHAESLLFAFHHLAKRYPQFLADESATERRNTFKIRLQYFARGVQTYIKQLRAVLQDKKGADLKTDENKIKVMALKITTNINLLVKDFLHTPPSYKATVSPSWTPVSVKPDTTLSPGEKRAPITFDSDVKSKKQARVAQTMYTPPRDKYSYSYNSGPQGRGTRGRGGRSF